MYKKTQVATHGTEYRVESNSPSDETVAGRRVHEGVGVLVQQQHVEQRRRGDVGLPSSRRHLPGGGNSVQRRHSQNRSVRTDSGGGTAPASRRGSQSDLDSASTGSRLVQIALDSIQLDPVQLPGSFNQLPARFNQLGVDPQLVLVRLTNVRIAITHTATKSFSVMIQSGNYNNAKISQTVIGLLMHNI